MLLFTTISLVQITSGQVGIFDFEDITSEGMDICQVVGTVKMTVSSLGGISWGDDYDGWGGITGNSIWNMAATFSITLTFDKPVNISSLIMADNTGGTEYYTLTPTPNTGTQDVTVIEGSGTTINLSSHFQNITAITITQRDENNFFYAVDDLVLQAVLPVELTSFTASITGNNVNLNWQTATEINNYGFSIERRVISKEYGAGSKEYGHENNSQSDPSAVVEIRNSKWEELGFVKGNGNSNSPVSYLYTDNNVPGAELKYRLKQIDIDGKFKYSTEVTVNVEGPGNFSLLQNYPNPFNPVTTISYTIPASERVVLRIFDMLGKEISCLDNEEKAAGYYEAEFNAENLAGGIYFYSLHAGGFSDSKKFILLK